jgi:hypothetical protein
LPFDLAEEIGVDGINHGTVIEYTPYPDFFSLWPIQVYVVHEGYAPLVLIHTHAIQVNDLAFWFWHVKMCVWDNHYVVW